ncbi:hypothetical protein OG400_29690 [Micromonospora ureilytica]|uniref:hypothetical protein n=1 Tax=Micromonospora ureilytica TaxID=709868 RepID=UPI002E122B8A|nr:hypothetical protein OG400_29690 [Micromonospora ureilytica]
MAKVFDLGDPLGVIVELPFLDLVSRDVLPAEAARLGAGVKDPVKVSIVESSWWSGTSAFSASKLHHATSVPMLAQSTGSNETGLATRPCHCAVIVLRCTTLTAPKEGWREAATLSETNPRESADPLGASQVLVR